MNALEGFIFAKSLEICRIFLEFGANRLLKNKKGKTARDVTDSSKIKKMLENWEIGWFGKLIGTENVNNILDAVKECNPEKIYEIVANL